MERTDIVDPARRPRNSCKVVMSTPTLEHAVFVLKRQAVLLTVVDERRTSSAMVVGQELEARLRIPPHQLRITCHGPEDYLIIFDLPVHQEQVVKLGSLTVDGAKFFIKRWHEDDHAVIQPFNHHVHVVIEKMPQHFWSVEGAKEALGCRVDRLDSRTFERSNTKSFACWVWVWDVALIPTKQTIWLMQRGAGRVEEMLGFFPPGRVVAAPPSAIRHDVLIHVNRIEDWTPYTPRSSRSPQSGLPSSDSDDDDRPMPRIIPGSWKKGVGDGQREPQQRRHLATLADMGCHGGARGGSNRKDDDGDDQGRRRSWKYALLGRSRAGKEKAPEQEVSSRRRSCSPLGQRRSESSRGRQNSGRRHAAGAGAALLQAPRPLSLPVNADAGSITDPIADFFASAKNQLPPPAPSNYMAAELEAHVAAAVSVPLQFNDHVSSTPMAAPGLQDAFGPTLAGLSAAVGHLSCKEPARSAVVELQL